jgi:uncharacterized protein
MEETHPNATSARPVLRDLNRHFTEEEEWEAVREIPLIIQQIRLRRGRRLMKGQRGRLWVKKMIRESLAHGGVPFSLPMRERRPRAPRVVLMVDVSHSVARAAGLFLLICAGLSERLRRTETIFFVDRALEATALVKGWAVSSKSGADPGIPRRAAPPTRIGRRRRTGRGDPGAGIRARRGGSSFTDLLTRIEGLNLTAPSDYGRAFFQAKPLLAHAGGRDTVFVVLGDARSNAQDPLVWAFEDLAASCRKVIWLNPEPMRLWNTGDSVMEAYQPFCDVVCETRDLAGLARGVREITRCL